MRGLEDTAAKPIWGNNYSFSYEKITNKTNSGNQYWDKAALPNDFNQIEISDFDLDMNMYRENKVSQFSRVEKNLILQNFNKKINCESSTPDDIHQRKILKSELNNDGKNYDNNHNDKTLYKHESGYNQKKIYEDKSGINNKIKIFIVVVFLFIFLNVK